MTHSPRYSPPTPTSLPPMDPRPTLERLLCVLHNREHAAYGCRMAKSELNAVFTDLQEYDDVFFWGKENLHIAVHNYYVGQEGKALWSWIRGSYRVSDLIACFSYHYTFDAYRRWMEDGR